MVAITCQAEGEQIQHMCPGTENVLIITRMAVYADSETTVEHIHETSLRKSHWTVWLLIK